MLNYFHYCNATTALRARVLHFQCFYFDNYQNKLLSCMGVEYNQPAHLLDRYIKGGDINGGRLYKIRTN